MSAMKSAGRYLTPLLATCCLLAAEAPAAVAETDATALVAATGVHGGLALVLGAKDLSLATALAAESTLYVQVLQPDANTAARWGLTLATSKHRESIGVRNAAFDTEHYGIDLFNLIVVEDAAAAGKATPEDLCRLLVPTGFLAIRAAPDSFTAEARRLNMAGPPVASFQAVFRKPTQPLEWQPCDSVKWRAGPCAQLSSGWASVTAADGKFFYRERMEIPGTLEASSSQLFARDAYNGRVLWSIAEEEAMSERGWAKRPLAAGGGRTFTTLGDKLVCLDSATGKPLFDVVRSGLKSRSILSLALAGDLLLAYGEFGFRGYSAADAGELWNLAGVKEWTCQGPRLFTHSGAGLTARSLGDPKTVLWTAKGDAAKLGVLRCSGKYVHVLRLLQCNYPGPDITTVNAETGEIVWSHSIQRTKGRDYACEFVGDKCYVLAYSPYENKVQDLWMTRLDIHTGRVEAEDCGPKGAEPYNMCAPWAHQAGKYLVYFFSVWIDPQTNQRTFPYLAHPSCGIGTIFANGMLYNLPSRKAGALQGISAMCPADILFDHEPGGKVLRTYTRAQLTDADARENEWPMFRANPQRGNAVQTDLGTRPTPLWTAALGLGGKSFGVMSGQRTGLTQAVAAGGLVVVADIDAQRIVALDAAEGKTQWIFPVGSRVDFPPTLYKGLCLLAAKDGWVYCLRAADGALVWKLLVAPRERLIGGQDKLESLWPMVSDVLVVDGVGYASAGLSFDHLGGVRAVAFRPQTGEVLWSRTYFDPKHSGYGPGPTANMLSAGDSGKGPAVAMGDVLLDPASGEVLERRGSMRGTLRAAMDDYLAGGVSIPRNGEDRAGIGLEDGRIWGKTIAFDSALSVAYAAGGGPETWQYKGKIRLYAKTAAGQANRWEKPGWEMTVDDIVLTPRFVYCVGHYQRVEKQPELVVLSREEGKLLGAAPLDGFPAFNGMSAAGKRLFISTREGKLMCYGTQ
jgi:outer membrane protein assembly factor BamB